MRIGSKSVVALLFLSGAVAACTVSSGSEPSGAGAAEPSSSEDAPKVAGEEPAPAAAAPEANDDGSEPSAPAADDADGGAPAVDAGIDAAPKPKIPPPTTGFVHAYASNDETCEFSIDGVYKSTGKVLDAPLYADTYVIGCKRSNGTVLEKAAEIKASTTTNVVFYIQTIPKPVFDSGVSEMGELVGVAVGGSCAFSVNGEAVGSGATFSKDLPAGTYTVACKPVAGATKSRSVTVTAGGTAMAMFKL